MVGAGCIVASDQFSDRREDNAHFVGSTSFFNFPCVIGSFGITCLPEAKWQVPVSNEDRFVFFHYRTHFYNS